MSKRSISLVLVVVVLVLGVVFGVLLIGRDQDFRERAAPSSTITLSTSNQTPSVGDTFTISANINTGGNELIAAELYFTFDPDKLEVLEVQDGTYFDDPDVIGPTIDNNTGNVDYIVFILPGTTPSVSQEGTLVSLVMSARSPGSTVVSLSPDTIVGALDENSNVLVNSFPATIDIQGDQTYTSTSTEIGGSGQDNLTPTTVSTPTPLLSPTSIIANSLTPSPSPAITLPEELPDTGVGEVVIGGLIIGMIFVVVSMVMFAL